MGKGNSPACIDTCSHNCQKKNRDFEPVDEEWRSKSDEEMFSTVDVHNKGHFTYAEFLKQKVWEDDPEARKFFDRYVSVKQRKIIEGD